MKITLVHICAVVLVVVSFTNCQMPARDKDVVERRDTNAGMLINFQKYGLVDLAESHQFQEILCQSWENKEDYEDGKEQVSPIVIDRVSRGYSFFSDGTAVKNPRGEFNTGTWTLNDLKKPYSIDLKLSNGQRESFQVAALKPFALTLNLNNEQGKKLVEFVGPGLHYRDEGSDPFHPSQNKWRKRPVSLETETMISARLKGCLHFFIRFYEHNIDALSQTVNFTGLPSCFRWYAGGIFLFKEKDMPVAWINCFYDRVQAMKAYRMADELLSKKYTWPKGETNWLKQNLYVLKQMEDKL